MPCLFTCTYQRQAAQRSKISLSSVYGEKFLRANPPIGWPQRWPREFLAEVSARRNDYDAFSAHAAFGIHEAFGRNGLYISSVRDPIDRFESYYNFVRHWGPHHHHELAKKLSIGAFFRRLNEDDDIELYNLQCLLLCGTKNFDTARDFILRNYFFIIPLRYFDGAINMLAEELAWPAVEVLKLNVSEHQSRIDELTESDFKTLLDRNSADRNLVRFCEDYMGCWFDQAM